MAVDGFAFLCKVFSLFEKYFPDVVRKMWPRECAPLAEKKDLWLTSCFIIIELVHLIVIFFLHLGNMEATLFNWFYSSNYMSRMCSNSVKT